MELAMNGTTMGSRLGELASKMTSSEAPVSVIANVTEIITQTLASNLTSYDPGFGNSTFNTTDVPPYEPANSAIKKIVVIFTNVFVLLSIIFTCFLAFKHKQWETRMKKERLEEKTDDLDYDLVDIDEGDEDEDVEIFDN